MRTIALNEDDMGCAHGPDNRVTCGTCEGNWCDICNPTPSGRCLYEDDHDEDQEFAAFLANNDIKIDPTAPLAPHGGCNWSGCTTCFPPKDEPNTVELMVDDEWVEFRPVADIISRSDLESVAAITTHSPREIWEIHNEGFIDDCPVCGDSGGFHLDGPHRNVDPKYLLDKGWHNV